MRQVRQQIRLPALHELQVCRPNRTPWASIFPLLEVQLLLPWHKEHVVSLHALQHMHISVQTEDSYLPETRTGVSNMSGHNNTQRTGLQVAAMRTLRSHLVHHPNVERAELQVPDMPEDKH